MHVGESFDILPILAFPLFIDNSLSFLLLFYLIKPLLSILLFYSFPMPITMLESEFRIKSYGFPKIFKSSLTFPPHYHVASMWFPITCVILCSVDVAPITYPHSHWDLPASCPPILMTAFPDDDIIRPSHRRSSTLPRNWTLLTPFSDDDDTCPLSLSELYSSTLTPFLTITDPTVLGNYRLMVPVPSATRS